MALCGSLLHPQFGVENGTEREMLGDIVSWGEKHPKIAKNCVKRPEIQKDFFGHARNFRSHC